jgi:hypothetical protein
VQKKPASLLGLEVTESATRSLSLSADPQHTPVMEIPAMISIGKLTLPKGLGLLMHSAYLAIEICITTKRGRAITNKRPASCKHVIRRLCLADRNLWGC